jgi:hypothetical protein
MKMWRGACRILAENPRGKRPLGGLRRRWEYNVALGEECLDWINLVQEREKWRDLVNSVMNFRVP